MEHNDKHHRSLRRQGQAGFTMLEVAVCLVILAIAIPAFLAAVAQNVQLEAMNYESDTALNAANRIIEDLKTLSYSQVTTEHVPATFEATGLTNDGRELKLTNSANSTDVGRVTITEGTPGKEKTVQVTVTWRSITGSERSITLISEVNNY